MRRDLRLALVSELGQEPNAHHLTACFSIRDATVEVGVSKVFREPRSDGNKEKRDLPVSLGELRPASWRHGCFSPQGLLPAGQIAAVVRHQIVGRQPGAWTVHAFRAIRVTVRRFALQDQGMKIRPVFAAAAVLWAAPAVAGENEAVRFAIFQGYTAAIEASCPAYFAYPGATSGQHLSSQDLALALAEAPAWRAEMQRNVSALGCDAAARDALAFTDLSFQQVWEYKQ
jgi:hypothetical protein